ncbi:MAG TPA: phosphatase PAP2 family protein [Thermoleophilaceae bacterium]
MTGRTRTALLGALLAAAGIALLRVLAFNVGAIHHADALTLHGFMSLDRPSVHRLASGVAHVADPAPYGFFGLLLIWIALVRGRVRQALGVAVILGGAAVTTDRLLKPVLEAHRYSDVLGFRQVPDISFPSGHATASMALALCAIVVASPAFRPYVAALGALFAVAVSYAFLSLGWHYPSDVLGGYLVAGFWTAIVVAALSEAEARWPARSGRRAAGLVLSRVQARALMAAVAGALILAAVVVAAVAPERTIDFLRVHTIFAVGAAAIAVASVAVAGVLTAMLRD